MKKYNLEHLRPCNEALRYFNICKTNKQAWNKCPRGDWMLWIASKLNVNIHLLTLTKTKCALTVKHLMKDERSIKACNIAIKFGYYKATMIELIDAADAARAAAKAAATTYATAAATYAATDAAYAAVHAIADAADTAAAAAATAAAAAVHAVANAADTAAANAAAYAADAAANVAANAAAYATNAKKKNQKQTANICRKYLTKEIFKKIK